MNFYIKKNSELPLLTMELIFDGRNDFRHFYELIQNADITFSMYNPENNIKKISCRPAEIVKKIIPCEDLTSREEYYIVYKWRQKDTKEPGTYVGEFSIDFLDGTGVLITPIQEKLFIHVIN
jgi:hypothetical protein